MKFTVLPLLVASMVASNAFATEVCKIEKIRWYSGDLGTYSHDNFELKCTDQAFLKELTDKKIIKRYVWLDEHYKPTDRTIGYSFTEDLELLKAFADAGYVQYPPAERSTPSLKLPAS